MSYPTFKILLRHHWHSKERQIPYVIFTLVDQKTYDIVPILLTSELMSLFVSRNATTYRHRRIWYLYRNGWSKQQYTMSHANNVCISPDLDDLNYGGACVLAGFSILLSFMHHSCKFVVLSRSICLHLHGFVVKEEIVANAHGQFDESLSCETAPKEWGREVGRPTNGVREFV